MKYEILLDDYYLDKFGTDVWRIASIEYKEMELNILIWSELLNLLK